MGLLAGLLISTSVVSVPATGSDVIVGEAEVCMWVGDELRTGLSGGVNDSSSENIVGKGNCGSSSISDSSPELANTL